MLDYLSALPAVRLADPSILLGLGMKLARDPVV